MVKTVHIQWFIKREAKFGSRYPTSFGLKMTRLGY